MKKKKQEQQKPKRTCADCIHEWACQARTHGTIHNMNADSCAIYETARDSAAYLIGYMEGKKATKEGNAAYLKKPPYYIETPATDTISYYCPNCGAKMNGGENDGN